MVHKNPALVCRSALESQFGLFQQDSNKRNKQNIFLPVHTVNNVSVLCTESTDQNYLTTKR